MQLFKIYQQLIMMKAQVDQMMDERTQFLQKWLTSASSHEARDSQHFINQFLHLLEHDLKTQHIFLKNLSGLLQSHQTNLVPIFQYCLSKKDKVYVKQICGFIGLCMDEKNQIGLSWDMEKYLIHNIWRDKFTSYLQVCNISTLKIMEYLSLKMRSLNSATRYEAVVSMYDIIQSCQNGQKSNLLFVVQQVLPQMIEKQNYGKQVCFYRGVLLQILQDQLCHIKKKGIQLLGKAQRFLEPNMIRPLILYMLNDEHQVVREACLTVLSQIPSLDIEKEDLNALLVCLKENNTLMRSYTYENLSHINVTSAEDFKKIIDRLLVTLSNRNEDKKKIYIVCSKLGRKYPNFVLANLQHIYKFSDDEQPNWKSIVYRARFIAVASIGTNKWPKTLPKYFNNHYLYIRDVLLYAFQQKISDSKLLTDLNEQTIQQQTSSKELSINLTNTWQIYHYVKAKESIIEGFPKSIFSILLKWIEQTKLFQHYQPNMQTHILLQLQKLHVLYNLTNSPLVQQLVISLQKIIKQCSIYHLSQFLKYIWVEDTWKQLEKIQSIIFKISSTDKNKIVISNISQILKRSFIEFTNVVGSNGNGQMGGKEVGYLRMSLVDFEDVNQKICYYRINFKCKQIRCFILYGHPPQYHVTQPYTLISNHPDWITNLVT